MSMPNYLKMPKKSQVLALLELGWSYHRIERQTGVRRETVSGHDEIRRANAAKTSPAPCSRRHLDFLDLLVQDELTRRADRLFARRLKQAGGTLVKESSGFDWAFNPKIPRARLVDLATARFIHDHHGALLIGPPAVGKSHAAAGERRDFVHRLTTVDLLVLEDSA
jgi:DNA replication protein DnaC